MSEPDSPFALDLPIGPDRPWLAPLAGYSDLPFRLLCRELGAACCVTEMVSAKGFLFGSRGTEPLLATSPEDAPLVAQIFAPDPELAGEAVRGLRRRGFTHFDLNAGCSVRKVLRGGCGAALLADPARLADVARAMVRAAGPGRVGVKLRLGLSANRPVHLESARRLAEAGAAWLCLHPRFASQGFTGAARWEELAAFKGRASVPVLASGDLFTPADAAACLDRTGVDGVMFARGALADPAVFRRFAALLAGNEPPGPSGTELALIIRRHAALCREHAPERRCLLRLRSQVSRYLRGLPGAKGLRLLAVNCDSWQSLEKLATRVEALDEGPLTT